MDFINTLPTPINAPLPKIPKKDKIDYSNNHSNALQSKIPPYLQRGDWVPRDPQDFENGGAFPEIHVPQYPPGFENPALKTSNSLVKTVDEAGNVKYDTILNQTYDSGKVVHTTLAKMTERTFGLENINQVTEEDIKRTTEETTKSLEKMLNKKISSSVTVQHAEPKSEPEYIRYTPAYGSKGPGKINQRIIKMVDAPVDPMEPSNFKLNKKVPRGPPSPPAPVLHSPTRKVTNKEAQDWKIPPCISNWKNTRGYTIPLHMRVAADGHGLQNLQVNENFAKLTESLYIAENNARKAVEYRAAIEKKKAQKEKELNEEKLRKLAEQARRDIAAVETSERNTDQAERDEIRHERNRQRQRDRNIRNAAPEKRSKLEKEKDRDISEKIALGLPNVNNEKSETAYDHRLFNQSSGLNSGFVEDEAFNVYDKPWQSSKNVVKNIYQPSKNIDEEVYGADVSKITSDQRFVPDKPFSGAEGGQARKDGPVEFENDPFELDKFFNEVKQGKKK